MASMLQLRRSAAGTASCSGVPITRPHLRQVCRRGNQCVTAAVTAERASLDLEKMAPIHDRVLVKPQEDEPRTPGGILLPKGPPKANSDAHIGEVISIGEDVKLNIKKGDTIVFHKYAVAEVEVPAGNVLFVAEKSILAVLDPR